MGTFLVSSSGFTAIKLLLNPIFSACAIDSSVVPVFEQTALKLINSSLFSYIFDIG